MSPYVSVIILFYLDKISESRGNEMNDIIYQKDGLTINNELEILKEMGYQNSQANNADSIFVSKVIL